LLGNWEKGQGKGSESGGGVVFTTQGQDQRIGVGRVVVSRVRVSRFIRVGVVRLG
jgi:hypothetical protein